MKKLISLLVVFLFCFVSACSPYKGAASAGNNTAVIDFGKYYKIYSFGNATVGYSIYNEKGEVVLSKTTNHPLKINMIQDNIVDIEIGMGTGIATHQYYDALNNAFSEEFNYVLANHKMLVAYIRVPQKNAFAGRSVVVQNIFNKNLFYQEYALEFSKTDTPVTNAAFLNNGASLMVEYLFGAAQAPKTATLPVLQK